MKKLTKGQRFALAREARRLAMEEVAGTAPHFGTGQEFKGDLPWCAMGHVGARVGIGPETDFDWNPLSNLVPAWAWNAVTTANDQCRDALPWTLLALADALEASETSLPKAAP